MFGGQTPLSGRRIGSDVDARKLGRGGRVEPVAESTEEQRLPIDAMLARCQVDGRTWGFEGWRGEADARRVMGDGHTGTTRKGSRQQTRKAPRRSQNRPNPQSLLPCEIDAGR